MDKYSHKWISKEQPIYVWKEDFWYNERDGKTYVVNLDKQCWEFGEDRFYFTKKTKIMKSVGYVL